jgi:3-hydroxyisobutyrate dehydrogenase-like beta-hydroxyacid dehydrogenase
VQQRLLSIGRPDIGLIDCPLLSRHNTSTKEASLTVLASGSAHAIENANGILPYLADNVLIISGGIGSASNVKMINNFLLGTQTAAAAEAMGLAARAGLDTREVYEIITNAAGNSWAFEDRVPAMLKDDWKPLSSTLDMLVKEMVRFSTYHMHRNSQWLSFNI